MVNKNALRPWCRSDCPKSGLGCLSAVWRYSCSNSLRSQIPQIYSAGNTTTRQISQEETVFPTQYSPWQTLSPSSLLPLFFFSPIFSSKFLSIPSLKHCPLSHGWTPLLSTSLPPPFPSHLLICIALFFLPQLTKWTTSFSKVIIKKNNIHNFCCFALLTLCFSPLLLPLMKAECGGGGFFQ